MTDERFGIEWDGNDVAILTLRGEHDISSAPAIQAQLTTLIRAGELVVVDLGQAESIDLHVVRTLLAADEALRARGRSLVLELPAACSAAALLARIDGIDEQLAQQRSRLDAVALVRALCTSAGFGVDAEAR